MNESDNRYTMEERQRRGKLRGFPDARHNALSMLEPPYGIIWNALRKSQVVPFLGAGASLVGRGPSDIWNPSKPEFLPKGTELARFLADEAGFPSQEPWDRDDLAKVSSYYSDISTRQDLRQQIRDVLNHPYKCGSLHTFLASVPGNLLFVVTNYDTLLEQAFDAAGRPYDLVVYASDRDESAGTVLWKQHGESQFRDVEPKQLYIDLNRSTVIFKMHGTIDPTPEMDSYVITEEDYVEFLSRMTDGRCGVPAIFLEHFRTRKFLFLGYSLRDWNLRVVLRNISARLSTKRSEQHSWAIQWNVSELERTLWGKRQVTIFDMSLDDFVCGMQRQAGPDRNA